ncbi:MAG TPA: DUF4435 domain-containing protein [Candidatus Blautia faecipullorum]|nr:DUF4435 domain-containing protein [Candidatus Blautia faecipullorum]
MRYDLEETIIAGLMCNKPVVIVEGQDDIKFYDNIATLNGLNVDVCAVEMIEGYTEGREQVINAMTQAESLIHNDDGLKMYIMGIIDRDVRQYLNNVPEIENLLVLKYYSYETHLITDSTIKSIVEQLTRASGTMITQNAVDYLKEEFNIQSDHIIRSVAFAGSADKLKQMKGVAVVLVKPEKCLHNVLGAAGGFGNKIDIVDIQNPGNFHESIFFGNTIAGFILRYTNISVAFRISQLQAWFPLC